MLDEALELEPGNVEAWRLMGRVSLFEGEPGAALDAARRAIELAPEDFEAHLLLGQAHAASARPKGSDARDPDRAALGEALAAFERAVGLADAKTAWRAVVERAGSGELARARAGGPGRLPRGARFVGRRDLRCARGRGRGGGPRGPVAGGRRAPAPRARRDRGRRSEPHRRVAGSRPLRGEPRRRRRGDLPSPPRRAS